MTETVELPLWLFALILAFAAVTAATHFLFPSVRWFFRRRLERVVAQLNTRLARPIQPFKLARRPDTIQRLTYDTEVIAAATAEARSEGIPESVAVERARRYAREIVPSFSATAYFGIAIRIARWLSEALYKVRIVQLDDAAHAAIPADATVVYVINHRSNMDYVLVTYLAASQSALSYAVGEWARVWPVSRLIRAMGGYFIRRRSRGALYRKVLARYVQMATDGGVTQAVFPEGGLSLTGAVQDPKLGILSYILGGAQTAAREIVFVPVALNYDRVLEDLVLLEAAETGTRRFGLGPVSGIVYLGKLIWRRLSNGSYRFGYAAVSFGAPLPLSALLPIGCADPVPVVADRLMAEIRASVPVLPVPLVASVLLEAETPLTEVALVARMEESLSAMPKALVRLPGGDVAAAAQEGLETLRVRKMVEKSGAGTWSVRRDRRVLLTFYARSIAHLSKSVET
ncbi:MAG: 1-acyl-sn-glycerol-3-phosphate acyltransferase [Pseudomonadota bacterium]